MSACGWSRSPRRHLHPGLGGLWTAREEHGPGFNPLLKCRLLCTLIDSRICAFRSMTRWDSSQQTTSGIHSSASCSAHALAHFSIVEVLGSTSEPNTLASKIIALMVGSIQRTYSRAVPEASSARASAARTGNGLTCPAAGGPVADHCHRIATHACCDGVVTSIRSRSCAKRRIRLCRSRWPGFARG